MTAIVVGLIFAILSALAPLAATAPAFVVERIKTIDIAVRTERGMTIPDVYLNPDAAANTDE
jgi:hypothetical protein